MILPTGATVAVADGETVRLFHNIGVKPGVHLVEITAYSDGDAYSIFETMNDRGLSLTPADMLKGYLLASIADADKRSGGGLAH